MDSMERGLANDLERFMEESFLKAEFPNMLDVRSATIMNQSSKGVKSEDAACHVWSRR